MGFVDSDHYNPNQDNLDNLDNGTEFLSKQHLIELPKVIENIQLEENIRIDDFELYQEGDNDGYFSRWILSCKVMKEQNQLNKEIAEFEDRFNKYARDMIEYEEFIKRALEGKEAKKNAARIEKLKKEAKELGLKVE